ncbi:MAG: hypothetical protein K0Q66_2001, partial [Chitinophagaceae bacterium]|nr:hypothetical protein [Chitinophagaceae bacterium]
YYLTDFYFGKGGLIDIFRKDSKDWFWTFYKKQMDFGVEAWWGDLGEPEKHPSNLYHNLKDLGHKRLFAADEVHNIYGHNWTKMLYQKYAKEYPNKRLFSLNRSGFAGSQRYGIFPWTGDVSRSWSGLRAQLPILLGMTMSGVPYVHSDAGGFAGGEGDPELYVRWLQFAAFTPIFRPHGTALYDVEPNAFSFPSEAALIDTPWRKYAKDVIRMRYGFLPYNYSLAYLQQKDGKPLMAPLYYYYPNDTVASSISDQFMWGEHIIVAPVLEKGAGNRRFYLPEGVWYNLLDERKPMNGGKWYEQSVGPVEFPVLLREGCFVPFDLREIGASTNGYDGDTLSILYALSGKPSFFQLFLDDGRSKNSVATGKYELISFSSPGKNGNSLAITVQSNGGLYAGKPLKRVMQFAILAPAPPKQVRVNGRVVKHSVNEDAVTFHFDTSFSGKPLNIQVTW